MNVLSNLTIKNLKLNKVRTMVTLVGIILSTALLVALSGLGSSFLYTMEQMCIANDGQQHVVFYDVPKEELSAIQLHKDTEHYYMVQFLDTCIFEGNGEVSGDVIAMDVNGLKENENQLVSGRLPENTSEILLGNDYMYDGIKLGDDLTLSDGKTYEVVGEINEYGVKPDMYENPIIRYMEEPTGDTNIAVTYKNVKNYEEITKSIVGEEVKYDYSYNKELLRYQAHAMSGGTMQMIYTMGAIVALIIILTSVFCIRNSFAISITEKIRQYGMLASVGATPRQIRKNVLFEGAILGLIGIPVGVGSGILAAWVLIKLSNYLLIASVSGESMLVFDIDPIFIGIAMLLAIITIYLSSISSAIRASRIPEIEAIRSTQEIKIKAGQVKVPKYVSKLLGIGGVFAYKNMKRNKRKFRTTTISLIVSIATFISLSSFIELGFQMSRSQFADISYNVLIHGDDAEEVWNHFSDMDITDEIIEKSDRQSYPMFYKLEEESGEGYMSFDLYTMDDEYFDSYLKEQNIVYDEAVVVLLDQTYTTTAEGKRKEEELIKNEDCVILTYGFEDSNQIRLNYVRPEEYPLGIVPVNEMGVLMSHSQFAKYALDEMKISNSRIYLNTEDSYKVEKAILAYGDANNLELRVANIDETVKAQNNILLLISIFLYGFITVIMLVGLTNIFNSLSTNMNLRRKEFATLQSVGMTKKEFSRMITFESVSYVVKALLWGIPLGLAGGYALYQASGYGSVEYAFAFPWKQILGASIVVFLVVYGIMKTSLSKIAKQNIIETIRQENI